MSEVARTRRVAALLKRELAQIIATELQDNRINGVTVTEVTVSRDLRQATVYFSTFHDTPSPEQLEKLLNHSAGYVRHAVSRKVSLKTTPALHFKFDTNLEQGIKLSALIDRLNRGHGG